MANIFLDTNVLVDALGRGSEQKVLVKLENHDVYVSPLSFHIYCYLFKIKIPNKRIFEQKDEFNLVPFSDDIVRLALDGPTADFEDNVQLHSAAFSEADIFLTEDKDLLKMKFFGRMRVSRDLG